MTEIFTAILNMSITASYVALAVIAIRLLLNKVPKVFSYALWSAVLIRLLFPFSFNSVFSFFSVINHTTQTNTGAIEYVPRNIGLVQNPAVDHFVNSSLPSATPTANTNTIPIMDIAGIIWAAGVAALLIYSIISYIKVISNVKTATLIRDNIFETDRISTPFVFGFIRPKIYVPAGISPNELSYILAHEQTHIKRLDYLIKPFAFLVLIVHWFNPLMWLSFALMSKDMEMSCDESVLKKMGCDVKGSYANSLLSLSVKRSRLLSGSPLAFGESSIKSRIKNVLHYKKPALWVVAAACIVTLIVIIGFTANPAEEQELSVNNIDKLATVWANALKTRDGKPRYEMMAEGMKERFKQEQIARSGENWNFNIGVSSPRVIDFKVKINGRTAHITYLTTTSEPAFYKSEETLTFGKEKGELVVADYQTVFKDKLIDSTEAGTFTADPKSEQSPVQKTYAGYLIETLMEKKTPYVGNNWRFGALIDAMPLPKGIVRETVELRTTAAPYGITINFSMKNHPDFKLQSAINGDAFYRNSIILFSLIDNVDVINCKIADKTGNYDGASYNFTFTRAMAEKLIGEDVRRYAESTDTLKSLIDRINNTPLEANTAAKETENNQIEKYLEIIMSSPAASSNPYDYIKAHQKEYENILKMGDAALNYLLAQFEKGDNNDLKGHIMMALCKDLLGDKNNVTDESLLPQDWFSRLSPYEEIKLPDFKANVFDPIEQLVYDEAIKHYSRSNDGFTVVAPTIFGSYEEGNKLKIFATVFSNRYKLHNKMLSEVGGSVVPVAITYIKSDNGKYTLQEYLEAKDGSYFSASIKDFCIMPVSGEVIEGLYAKIMNDYGSNKNRDALLIKNLREHLKANNQKDVTLNGQTLNSPH